MRSILSRYRERLPGGQLLRPIARPFSEDPGSASSTWAHVSSRSDIYARPDLYDMEYEGASNQDAQFFACVLARARARRVLELACGFGRVTFTLAAALPKAEIVGVDSSIEMLGHAASTHDAAESSMRQRVSFVKGDMRPRETGGRRSAPASVSGRDTRQRVKRARSVTAALGRER
jgi:SAM-dependent methyltransferase